MNCYNDQVPGQNNAYDCGIFMLYYIQRFIIEAPENFTRDRLVMVSGANSFLYFSVLIMLCLFSLASFFLEGLTLSLYWLYSLVAVGLDLKRLLI